MLMNFVIAILVILYGLTYLLVKMDSGPPETINRRGLDYKLVCKLGEKLPTGLAHAFVYTYNDTHGRPYVETQDYVYAIKHNQFKYPEDR